MPKSPYPEQLKHTRGTRMRGILELRQELLTHTQHETHTLQETHMLQGTPETLLLELTLMPGTHLPAQQTPVTHTPGLEQPRTLTLNQQQTPTLQGTRMLLILMPLIPMRHQ